MLVSTDASWGKAVNGVTFAGPGAYFTRDEDICGGAGGTGERMHQDGGKYGNFGGHPGAPSTKVRGTCGHPVPTPTPTTTTPTTTTAAATTTTTTIGPDPIIYDNT